MSKLLNIILVACVVLFTAGVVRAGNGEIELGDHVDEVYSILGRPSGYIHSGSFSLLYYDRGKVEVHDDIVTGIYLVSSEKARELKAARERRARERYEELLVEGLALQREKLEDPNFLSLPSADQLSFWRTFHGRYPMVSLDREDIAGLARDAAEEQRKSELENELLRMKWRLMDAEERAHKAELAARALEGRCRARTYSHWYPPQIVVHRRPTFSAGASDFYRHFHRPRITPVDPYLPLSGIKLSADANSYRHIPRHRQTMTPGVFPNRCP